jgi:tetratricopeptide (TPR) repeat protein
MKNRIAVTAIAALLFAGVIFAQAQPAPPAAAAQPSAGIVKQPQPKSQEEVKALQAIFQNQDPDARAKAIDEFVVKFSDSDYKPHLLMLAADGYRQKGDSDKLLIYAEKTLEADPKNYLAMLMISQTLAQRTREFDLDKEEKLGKSEKYANNVLEVLKTALKPRPDITDEQWAAAKKDFGAQAHEALGMSANARKKYDVAISEFKTAIETGAMPDPATEVRLGAALEQAGKYDEAIAVLEKVMAKPDVHPTIKQFAQAERARAIQAKNGGKAPAAPAPGAAAPAAPAAPADTKKP